MGETTMTKYLVNSFTPAMVELPAAVIFEEVSKEQFCKAAEEATSAIGHQSTAQVLTEICGFSIVFNRIQIKAKPGDELLIFTLFVRLEEGKVLNKEELLKLLSEGKIRFVKGKVLRYDVIADLVKCKGICDEKKYDYLVSELEAGEQQ